MNDLDQKIRAELERLVLVEAQPDWQAVVASAPGLQPTRWRRRNVVWVVVAALIIVSAAAAATGNVPWWQTGSHPQAVIEDAYRDGKLGRAWNCASLRAAIHGLPEDVIRYSHIDESIYRAAARRCEVALDSIAVGSTEQEVRTALGQPDQMNTCWRYSWKPVTYGTVHTNARICFHDGHVSQVQQR